MSQEAGPSHSQPAISKTVRPLTCDLPPPPKRPRSFPPSLRNGLPPTSSDAYPPASSTSRLRVPTSFLSAPHPSSAPVPVGNIRGLLVELGSLRERSTNLTKAYSEQETVVAQLQERLDQLIWENHDLRTYAVELENQNGHIRRLLREGNAMSLDAEEGRFHGLKAMRRYPPSSLEWMAGFAVFCSDHILEWAKSRSVDVACHRVPSSQHYERATAILSRIDDMERTATTGSEFQANLQLARRHILSFCTSQRAPLSGPYSEGSLERAVLAVTESPDSLPDITFALLNLTLQLLSVDCLSNGNLDPAKSTVVIIPRCLFDSKFPVAEVSKAMDADECVSAIRILKEDWGMTKLNYALGEANRIKIVTGWVLVEGRAVCWMICPDDWEIVVWDTVRWFGNVASGVFADIFDQLLRTKPPPHGNDDPDDVHAAWSWRYRGITSDILDPAQVESHTAATVFGLISRIAHSPESATRMDRSEWIAGQLSDDPDEEIYREVQRDMYGQAISAAEVMVDVLNSVNDAST